ncbi:protein of unknown function [Streptomyces murinus]
MGALSERCVTPPTSGLHAYLVAELGRQFGVRRGVTRPARREGGDVHRHDHAERAVVTPDAEVERHLLGTRAVGVRALGLLALEDRAVERGRLVRLRLTDQGVLVGAVLGAFGLHVGEHRVDGLLGVVDRPVDAAELDHLLAQRVGSVPGLVLGADVLRVVHAPLLGVLEVARGHGVALAGVALVLRQHRRRRDQLVRAVVRDAAAVAAAEQEDRAHHDRRHDHDRADDQAGLLLAATRLGRLRHAAVRLLLAIGLLAVRTGLLGHPRLLGVAVPRLLRRGLLGVAVAGLRRGLRRLPVGAALRLLTVRTRLLRLPVRTGLTRLSVGTRLLGWLAVRARLVVAHLWDPPRTLICP